MKKAFVMGVVLSSLLIACGASQKVTSFWANPEIAAREPYKSVFIIAMTQNRGARNVVETDLAATAAAEGIRATKSVDVFPPDFGQETAAPKEELVSKIRENNCEAIFTVSLIDVKSEQRYVPGTTTYAAAYAPYPYYGYYGGFYGYYTHTYEVVSTPGYYTTDKTYFIEANLYDAANEKIQWSMQSTAYNPSSLSSFSKEYAKLLINRLKTERAKAAGK